MYKKISILLVLVLLLAALTAVVYANSGGGEQINWRIAGPIFNNIEVTSGSTTQNFTMLSLSAKGAPGTAQVQVVGTGIPNPGGITELCPDITPETGLQIKFTDGGFVALFPDQSMLFFVVDESDGAKNALCITFDPTVATTGTFDYVITGGAGKYKGASGNATITLTSWGITSVLSAEVGEVTGTIELP